MNNVVVSCNVALVTALCGACSVLVSLAVAIPIGVLASVSLALGAIVDPVRARLIKGR
ncbi:hypothetical protein JTE88_05955 [Arcanobacterium phocisimile]|uniref:Uncharacterized protein n=1 Tax=Arcanobacterium phocisimile TaxID=1302235 RepID=A0ABX7IES8_9ACTO|nr:hypothetical protein [Arcanobacterium phocisimile]QRV01646.1 hypothetical protein JTE88_05955 [Arcanobacterium phocisimile]